MAVSAPKVSMRFIAITLVLVARAAQGGYCASVVSVLYNSAAVAKEQLEGLLW
jgi:hypothetical protein